MNLTTSVDSFDKLNCFPGVVKMFPPKLKVFEHAADSGNVAFTCRHFGISRETYYQWKRVFAAHGEKGLSTASPALRIPSYALRSPLRRRSFTCADLL
jgi:transposase-like protein